MAQGAQGRAAAGRAGAIAGSEAGYRRLRHLSFRSGIIDLRHSHNLDAGIRMVRLAGFQPDRSAMASVFLCAFRVFVLACAVTATVSAASAQEPARSGNFFDRIFGGSDRFGGTNAPAAPTGQPAQERGAPAPSDIMLRLDRLEAQIRQLTGTVEQLQFRNQQLEQYVRRMQEEAASPRPTQTRPQAAPSPLPPTATPAPG